MRFTTHNDDETLDANNTHLVGKITATRAQLSKVFGEPRVYGSGDGDGKVTLEWIIYFNDGTLSTIYDWKRYKLGTPGDNEVEEYHIGGRDFNAVTNVCDTFNMAVV